MIHSTDKLMLPFCPLSQLSLVIPAFLFITLGLNLPAFATTHSSQFGIKVMIVGAKGENYKIVLT